MSLWMPCPIFALCSYPCQLSACARYAASAFGRAFIASRTCHALASCDTRTSSACINADIFVRLAISPRVSIKRGLNHRVSPGTKLLRRDPLRTAGAFLSSLPCAPCCYALLAAACRCEPFTFAPWSHESQNKRSRVHILDSRWFPCFTVIVFPSPVRPTRS